MPTNTTLTALPATSVKRKTRDDDEGSGDEGSDVVSILYLVAIIPESLFNSYRHPPSVVRIEHGERRF